MIGGRTAIEIVKPESPPENIGKGDTRIFNPPTFPKGEQQGSGFHEAPHGTLSHWIVIKDGPSRPTRPWSRMGPHDRA